MTSKHYKNNYNKERIKLTILYSTIICVIVLILSFIIIQTQNRQLDRFTNPNRRSMLRYKFTEFELQKVSEAIREIKAENLRNIIILDFALIIPALIISYYLSGKTLEPIIASLEKQKRFISDASHELKTPLTNIKIEAEVLNRSSKATIDDYREFTSHVIEDVNRLDNLVVALLDSARLENNIIVQNSKIELNSFIRSVIEKFYERAKKKNIEIKFEQNNENILLESDRNLLERLISIIIDNAIKYNKENGQIIIKSFLNHDKKNVVSIKDTGVGIDDKHINRIFDRFYRVSEDRNEKGFGLGLAIAKEIAEKLNINIQVKSTLNKGTEFILMFN